MNVFRPGFLSVVSILLMLTASVETSAQTPARPPSRLRPNQSVRITRMVSPTFKVSPLVHRFEGRRGELIPFSFNVESLGRAARVRVRAVALTQEPSGIILPRDGVLPRDVIALDSPESFELAVGESLTINGRLRVPLADSSFFSCGLLVTDLGMGDPNEATAAAGEQRVQVRFMTQYLCRCDIRIPGGRLADVPSVELRPIRIVQHRGWPMLQVLAHNPTENAMEFELRCRFGSEANVKRAQSFSLMMPVRSSLDTKERYQARILPGATVRLESVVPRSVFNGDYVLQTELIANRRTLRKTATPINVRDADFPAQHVRIAELPSGVAVEPVQVELSAAENGSRMQAIRFSNRSSEDVTVRLRMTDDSGQVIDRIAVRPGRIEIPANGNRRVSVSAHPSVYRGGTQYCRVEAIVEGHSTRVASPVTVAVVGRESGEADVTPGQMRIDSTPAGLEVVVPLTNSGTVHLPLSGQIVVMAENGARRELLAGFGRWLLPGDQTELRFRLPSDLEPGQPYQLTTDIEFGTRLAAIQRTDPIELPSQVATRPGSTAPR